MAGRNRWDGDLELGFVELGLSCNGGEIDIIDEAASIVIIILCEGELQNQVVREMEIYL